MPIATHSDESLPRPLRIAIVGGGPGGLGAAIALSALPDIKVSVFEQAQELREIGAGINISYNCWRVLELLGAAKAVKGHVTSLVEHRNGLTGELLHQKGPSSLPPEYQSQRVRRTRLQSALISKVPEGIIQLKKRLSHLENLPDGVRLYFEDGTESIADLVVGGDGIRSVVRQTVFPDHNIKFTGTTIWRVLIPLKSVKHIPDMTHATAWWHGPAGHFYGCLVDDPSGTNEEAQMFEIAARSVIDPTKETNIKRFSWGIPATNERVVSHFVDYDPRVREALVQVPEGQWKEFSAFAGPRLEKLTAWDKVVLIGDASHPLSGAFGSGAAFAIEDGWILARAIEYSRAKDQPLARALQIFDEIRSPYYLRMYEHLDNQKRKVQAVAKESNAALSDSPNPPSQTINENDKAATFEKNLRARVSGFSSGNEMDWIYHNDIVEVWNSWVKEHGEDLGETKRA